MKAHTPGPWRVGRQFYWNRRYCLPIACKHTSTIAVILSIGPGYPLEQQDQDNAYLIAAAPDLLEALQDLHDQVRTFCETQGEANFETAKAVAAIKKATVAA